MYTQTLHQSKWNKVLVFFLHLQFTIYNYLHSCIRKRCIPANGTKFLFFCIYNLQFIFTCTHVPGCINQQPRQPWLGDQRNLGGPKPLSLWSKGMLLYLLVPPKSLFCPSNSIIPEAVFIIMSKLQNI